MRAIDAFAEHVSRHQEIAGEDVGLALDHHHVVRARVDTGFVAVEAAFGRLIAMQHEMPKFVGDGKAPSLLPGRTIVEDAPLGSIVRIANQRTLAARPRRRRCLLYTSAFGIRLRSLREAKGLTLQQVADAVGCTKAYIWELEKKPGQRPSAERIQAIAKILGVTMGDLMGEPVDEAPDATPDDVVFFREYVGMPEDEKRRYRQALEVMFGSRKDGDKK